MSSKPKEGTVVACRCAMDTYFPPRTVVYVATGRTLVLEGPKHSAELEITLTELDNDTGETTYICVFVPVAIVANHLRQAGWTVTPPAAQLPSYAEQSQAIAFGTQTCAYCSTRFCRHDGKCPQCFPPMTDLFGNRLGTKENS